MKSKIAVKRGGKLTHRTHRHAANGISKSREGRMRGRGSMRIALLNDRASHFGIC